MELSYWQKQLPDTPLFDAIMWARPENRHAAGKLLIIGGNAQSFAATSEAYSVADKSGAGVTRALLPDVLKKSVGMPIGPFSYAPSTPSGSFARKALQELLTESQWADAVLLAGDFGRNSETSALLETYVKKYSGPLVLTKDAVDYFYLLPELIARRQDTVLVLSLSQLQKLAVALHFTRPFLLSMGLLLLVQALHEFTNTFNVTIVTKEQDQLLVASLGEVISTKTANLAELWQVGTAARASVFFMQHSATPLEAIASSVL